MDLVESFISSRSVSVPFIAVETLDQQACLLKLSAVEAENVSQISWDSVRGFIGLNNLGKEWVARLTDKFYNPVDALDRLILQEAPLPDDSIVYMYLGDYLLNEQQAPKSTMIQALMNLRLPFKVSGRMVVLLGTAFRIPNELAYDLPVYEDSYPTERQLQAVIANAYKDRSLLKEPIEPLTDGLITEIVSTLKGVPLNAADQMTALSLVGSKANVDLLWQLKEGQLKKVPGVSFDNQTVTFEHLGGLQGVKDFLTDINPAASLYVRIEELDKVVSGMSKGARRGDGNGINDDILQVLLSNIQDYGYNIVLFTGVPGSGKSEAAKATGNQFNKKTILLDINAAQDQYVGNTGKNIRAQFKLLNALGGDRVTILASCNELSYIPEALVSRFLNVFFFDLPDQEELQSIWQISCKKWNVDFNQEKPDRPWSGREINKICRLASITKRSLMTIANSVPCLALSNPEQLQAVRQEANGKIPSAKTGELYRYIKDTNLTAATSAARKYK